MGAKWCSMAKVCNHDRVPVCGVSHAGDLMGFRDLCDMFDFNCLRRRSENLNLFISLPAKILNILGYYYFLSDSSIIKRMYGEKKPKRHDNIVVFLGSLFS